ncbi:MAG: magnesium transporter [Methanobacteriaceae archaeon]
MLQYILNGFTQASKLFHHSNKSSFQEKRFKPFFRENRRILGEGLVALLICAIGDLFAGLILGSMTPFLEIFPGLLVLIPGAIGMRGNIFGALGSRIGSNLHIGTISPEFKKSDILNQNIISSLILTLILSIFLAVMAKLICILMGFPSMSLFDFVIISVCAGMISSFIMIPITILIALKSYKNGWDPDNVTNPLIAAAGDLFTLPAIILGILILSSFDLELIKAAIVIIFTIIALAGYIFGSRQNNDFSKIIKQSTPVLVLCSFLGSSAGAVLNSNLGTVLSNPGLLTLIPIFSGESGSLISILSARLSSALHSGCIDPILRPQENTIRNFIIILILAIIIYPIIGIIVHIATMALGISTISFYNVLLITTISGLILISIMSIIVYYISSTSYSKGIDPDNIVIPIATSLTDPFATIVLMSISLAVLSGVIL